MFIAAAANGGKDAYEKLLASYEKCELQEERVKLLLSLGWTNDPELHKKTLDAALTVG